MGSKVFWDQAPLHAANRDRMSETAMFPLGRVQPHRQVAIGEVDEHPKVVRLDAVCDGLKRIHLERWFRLELVESAIIRTKPGLPVLLGDHKYRGVDSKSRNGFPAARR
jgi:hypothetical protein